MNGLESFPNILSDHECNHLITLFNQDDRRTAAKVGDAEINPSFKAGTDIYCNFRDKSLSQYNDIIFPAVANMTQQMGQRYPFLMDGIDAWEVDTWYNIQHYKHNEGFFSLHCEQAYIHTARMMAWMIYLNDSPCGTEFPYQQTTLQAIQGHGAMWSATWTHPHKGVTPNIGDKYIATGWCVFYDVDDPRPRQ